MHKCVRKIVEVLSRPEVVEKAVGIVGTMATLYVINKYNSDNPIHVEQSIVEDLFDENVPTSNGVGYSKALNMIIRNTSSDYYKSELIKNLKRDMPMSYYRAICEIVSDSKSSNYWKVDRVNILNNGVWEDK